MGSARTPGCRRHRSPPDLPPGQTAGSRRREITPHDRRRPPSRPLQDGSMRSGPASRPVRRVPDADSAGATEDERFWNSSSPPGACRPHGSGMSGGSQAPFQMGRGEGGSRGSSAASVAGGNRRSGAPVTAPLRTPQYPGGEGKDEEQPHSRRAATHCKSASMRRSWRRRSRPWSSGARNIDASTGTSSALPSKRM